VERAFDVGGISMKGVPVELTGFVSKVLPRGFTLVRYRIACCAANAVAAEVFVSGDPSGLRPDMWVRVDGMHGAGTSDPAILEATDVSIVRAPEDPYE
jgi:uncharacterized membrane protein YcgQ (UPF0703/DUF1980 family)